jgi:hypothetical protein
MQQKMIQMRLRLNIGTEAPDAAAMKRKVRRSKSSAWFAYVNRPDHFAAHKILVTPTALPLGHFRIDARLCPVSR